MALQRPDAYDIILDENEQAYASYVNIGGVWMGGLFAKHDLQPEDEIARYVGREYSNRTMADDVKDQSYMFAARMVQDGRKRVAIDGNPALYKNLAGYSNFVEGNAANAHFVDKWKGADDTLRTNVILQAATHIPSGTEIRVDYDMGSSTHPFRDQMIRKGIPPKALRDPSYKTQTWLPPNAFHASTDMIDPRKLNPKRSPKRPPKRPPLQSSMLPLDDPKPQGKSPTLG